MGEASQPNGYQQEQVLPASDISLCQRQLVEGSFMREILTDWGEIALKRVLPSMNVDMSDILRGETSTLERLKHPNLVMYYALLTRPEAYYMIQEVMPLGSLGVFLKKRKVNDRLKLNFAEDVARGMKFLHTHQPEVLHLRLKPENVLISGDLNAKVSDFGLRSVRENFPNVWQMESLSMAAYTPPEIWQNEFLPDNKFDVYSYGVLLWYIFSEKVPFEGQREADIRRRVVNAERPSLSDMLESTPSDVHAIIHDCWTAKKESRPLFRELQKRIEQLNVDCSAGETGRWRPIDGFWYGGIPTETNDVFGMCGGRMEEPQNEIPREVGNPASPGGRLIRGRNVLSNESKPPIHERIPFDTSGKSQATIDDDVTPGIATGTSNQKNPAKVDEKLPTQETVTEKCTKPETEGNCELPRRRSWSPTSTHRLAETMTSNAAAVFHFNHVGQVHFGESSKVVSSGLPTAPSGEGTEYQVHGRTLPVQRVKIRVPDKTVDHRVMQVMADHIGNHWKRLARQLGLSEGQIAIAQSDHGSLGLREVIYQMLLTWREVNGDNATVKALADALVAIKLGQVATRLQKASEES